MNDDPLLAHVRAFIRNHLPAGAPLCVALSGGQDSMVLLDALARLREMLATPLSALHVDHGLSPNAPAWAAFCARQCESRGVALRIERVNVGSTHGRGLEAAARTARYAAFARQPVDYLALAHHRQDQAETLLLRLLRGAGVRGLAAMRAVRELTLPEADTARRIILLRPMIEIDKAILQDYAVRHGVPWCTDESNSNTDLDRNFLREEILPRLAARFPHYAVTFARAAQNLAQANELIDEFTAFDRGVCENAGRLRLDALRALTPARAANAVRGFVREYAGVALTAAQTDELLRQLGLAGREHADDAQTQFHVGGAVLRVRRGEAQIEMADAEANAASGLLVPWRGEAVLALPAPYGSVAFTRERGVGVSAAKLGAAQVTLRSRRGGERLRPALKRPTRTLKNLLQESNIPAWQRKRLPLLFCGDELVCVPGLAIAAEYQAQPGEESIVVVWQQHGARQRA